MKKRFLILSMLIACLSLIGVGTAAYFTAEDTATNVITASNLSIELVESSVNDEGVTVPFQNVVGVVPGMEVSKIVRVENTGDADAYIRIRLETTITLAEHREGEVDLSLVTVDLNTADWTEKDGYYYCNVPVAAGEATPPLFTGVTFDASMGNLYAASVIRLNVDAQATQVRNNGASALEAAGWPQ